MIVLYKYFTDIKININIFFNHLSFLFNIKVFKKIY